MLALGTDIDKQEKRRVVIRDRSVDFGVWVRDIGDQARLCWWARIKSFMVGTSAPLLDWEKGIFDGHMCEEPEGTTVDDDYAAIVVDGRSLANRLVPRRLWANAEGLAQLMVTKGAEISMVDKIWNIELAVLGGLQGVEGTKLAETRILKVLPEPGRLVDLDTSFSELQKLAESDVFTVLGEDSQGIASSQDLPKPAEPCRNLKKPAETTQWQPRR